VNISHSQVLAAVETIGQTIIANRDYLNELDGAIGDADFGTSISQGFKAVLEQLPALASSDIGGLLSKVGMTLVTKVGGASGPLFGTAFMKAGQTVAGQQEISSTDLVKMLQAALAGVKMRGKAEPGEKTLIDALQPAVEAFASGVQSAQSLRETGRLAAEAARLGVEATKAMVATKGRAYYVGERSIGHPDAGATSIYLLFAAVCEKNGG